MGGDVVELDPSVQGIDLYHCDFGEIALGHDCVDLVMARSIMEHVPDPARVYAEIYRALKPDGHFIFLDREPMGLAPVISMDRKFAC